MLLTRGMLLLLCCLMGYPSAMADPAENFIAVTESVPPSADTYGLDSLKFPHASFAGSDATTLTRLLDGISDNQPAGISRDLLISILTMPVYPDGASAIPVGWFDMRVSKLTRIAAYDEAYRLVSSLPNQFMTATLAERSTDLAFSIGDISKACDATKAWLTSHETDMSVLWTLKSIFCHLYADETAQAELMLGIFMEQYPTEHPLATSLFNGWGNAKAPALPAYNVQKAPLAPLLSAAIQHSKKTRAQERITPAFISDKEVSTLPPSLALTLAEREVFPVALRIALMERATLLGAGNATRLRTLFEQVKPEDILSEQQRRYATYIADILSTQSDANKVSTVNNALLAFKRSYAPSVARALLSKELLMFSETPDRYQLTPELALDVAAFHLERGNLEEARNIKHYLERYSAQSETTAIALASIHQALVLEGSLRSQPEPALPLPAFSEGQRPVVMWMLRRLVVVKQALGEDVPAATESLSLNAPLADSVSVDSTLMVALQEAEQQSRSAELVLRSVQLLGDGRLAYVSDSVLARMISALQKLGLRTQAHALARDAVLNPPVAALNTSGPITASTSP